MLGEGGLVVNGYDLANLGVVMETWPGFQASPTRRYTLTDVWGRDGGAFLPSEARAQARDVTLTGMLFASSVAARRSAVNEIKRRLDAGELQVEFADRPGQRLLAYSTTFDFVPMGLDEFATAGVISIGLLAPSPVFEDIEPVLVAFGPRTAVPFGTGVTTGYIQLMGPATYPSFGYRDETGALRATMSFSMSLNSSDYLDINLQTSSVTLVQAGVRFYGGPYLISGDWPVLDPRDGVATLETANATGLLIAYRGWL